MLRIIEDCSPYYIRFTYDTVNDAVSVCLREGYKDKGTPFVNHKYPVEVAREILDKAPFPKELMLNEERVNLFITKPGCAYPAHKDQMNCGFGLNIAVHIADDLCTTSWYKDEDLAEYPWTKRFPIRECVGFDRFAHKPLKQVVFRQGECMLVNTNIYHDWDSSQSPNHRILLTFRDLDRGDERLSFEDARKVLFGY